MKVAHTTKLVAGEPIEQNWVFKDGFWHEVNRAPRSLQDSIRYIPTPPLRVGRVFDPCESAEIWTIE